MCSTHFLLCKQWNEVQVWLDIINKSLYFVNLSLQVFLFAEMVCIILFIIYLFLLF